MIDESKDEVAGFVGLFGHEYEDGLIQRQFQVVRRVTSDGYGVQLFSWLMGEPTAIEVWSAERLSACKFYADAEAWLWAWEKVAKAQDRERERRAAVAGLTECARTRARGGPPRLSEIA